MTWDIPADVAVFGLVVLAFFVIGLPVITRKISVPRRVDFASIADHDLTPAQTSGRPRRERTKLRVGVRTFSTAR